MEDVLRFVSRWAIEDQPSILVRDEYCATLHELEANIRYSREVYVTGHPGIGASWAAFHYLVFRGFIPPGKVLFFACLLIVRLGHQDAVVQGWLPRRICDFSRKGHSPPSRTCRTAVSILSYVGALQLQRWG